MSNERTITFFVQKEHSGRAELIFKQYTREPDDIFDCTTCPTHLVGMEFYDYKVSVFTDVVAELVGQGVAFDMDAGRSDENIPWRERFRFTDKGELIHKTWNSDQESIPVSDLVKLLDEPDRLRGLILEKEAEIQVDPWEHQIEYGKRFMLRSMISPDEQPLS